MRILALDCGGTRSSAILVDGRATLLAEQVLHAANVYALGHAAPAEIVVEALGALGPADAVALAVAGMRTDEDRRLVVTALQARGVSLPLFACSDAHAALRAGRLRQGVVVIAGTGSAALAVGADGTERRCGGWGSVLGDEGSGFWMGRELLTALLRAEDESSPAADRLREDVLGALALSDADALRGLAHSPEGKSRIARLLPVLASLWRNENPAAERIVLRAADELARLALTAAIGMDLQPDPVVLLAGGAFRALPEIHDLVAQRIGGRFEVRLLDSDPAWGALWLAQDRGSWDVGTAGSGHLPTERVNPFTEGLDRMSTREILRAMNQQDHLVAPAVGRCLDPIARVVDEAAGRMKGTTGARRGRLVYIGAGTSGRLAMLDAVECEPTFGSPPGEVIALVAGGDAALIRAVEGAEDDISAGSGVIERARISSCDVVIGVSASGSAPYVRSALEAARGKGAFTALLTCNPESPSLHDVNVGIAVDVGPEVIAGSSRLKAGTAQKLILNMISTAVMIRRGRTLGNRMIGVQPTNDKLRRRATRLVQDVTGASEPQARRILDRVQWDVASAVLAIRLGDVERTATVLRQHDGNLRAALEELDEAE